MTNKWQQFYDKDFLPWDTKKVSSHLTWYLTTPCVCGLLPDSTSTTEASTPTTTPGLFTVEGGHVWLVEGTAVRGPDYPSPLPSDTLTQPTTNETTQTQTPTPDANTPNPANQSVLDCPKCRAVRPQWQPGISSSLELGCGTGSSVVALAQVGLQAVGVDLVPEAVTAGWEAAEAAGVRRHLEDGLVSTTTVVTEDGAVVSEVLTPPTGGDGDNNKGSACFLAHDVFTLPRPFTHTTAVQLAKATTAISTTTTTTTTTNDAGEAVTTSTTSTTCTPLPLDGVTTTTTPPAANGADSTPGPALFDFVYDCQSWHALREVDEAGYMDLLSKSTAPGGLLMILAACSDPHPGLPVTITARDNETEAPKTLGPPKVTRVDLEGAFGSPDWEWMWLRLTRFDDTVYYKETMPEPPLAFWGLLRRTGHGAPDVAHVEGAGTDGGLMDGEWTLV